MAFALATGRWIADLAASDLLTRTGFGAVTTAQDHSGWLMACDAMSQLSRNNEHADNAPAWRVAFDGYLANAEELAANLPLAPADPKANPADLVAALLNARGPDGLNDLIGCFAIVAGHRQDGRVLAMRDRLGGRTLYVSEPRQGQEQDLILASRSAWVLRLGKRPFKPNRSYMIGHFAHQPAPPPGETALSGVREIMPGEQLELRTGQVTSQRRPLDLSSDFDYTHPGDCIDRFRQLFEQSIRTVLPANGDVACMLSGGLDSGPAAILADRELAQQDRRLHVCSWHLDQYPDADETQWIQIAANELSQPLELFDGNAMLPFSCLDLSVTNLDQPFYNGFRRLVNECYRLAAGHGCKVIINGNAGDQLYAPPYLINVDRLKRRQWRPIWEDLVRSWQIGGLRQILSDPALRHPVGRMARPWRHKAPAPAWLPPAAGKGWQPAQPWPPELKDMPFPEYAWQLLGSRMAYGRAHECEFPNRYGVDRRDPFHDEALVRFMLHAPFDCSYRKGWDKWIMRAATKDILPQALRSKRRTGLLHPFYRAGLKAHKDSISHLLFELQTDWQEFVQPDLIKEILDNKAHPREVMVSQCVGHALWTRNWQELSP